MDPSIYSTAFPPLPTSSSSPLLPTGSTNPLPWNRVFSEPPNASEFNISTLPTPDEIIDFPTEDITDEVEAYNPALVGYSFGKIPYYEALLSAVKKLWKLKGNIQLISLSEGFFLFKFSCVEDYDMVWTKGAWFIFGKPFIFKKWTSHFSPEREEYANVPIWFKIHDLPLCCWTPTGISKIAKEIDTPLAVDALTANKTRLTYARVCVQVDSSATYPASIPITVEGKLFNLRIQYEWHPMICDLCKSFNHQAPSCPSNPNPKPTLPPSGPRGRSTSRRPRPPSNSPKGILQNPNISTAPIQTSPPLNDSIPPPVLSFLPSASVISEPISFCPLPAEGSQPFIGPLADIPSSKDISPTYPEPVSIPNLNSPTQPSTSSTELLPPQRNPPLPKSSSPNKFSILQTLSNSESNTDPENATQTRSTKTDTETSSPRSSSKLNTSQPNTAAQSTRNTRGKDPGRIGLKWNASKVSFTPVFVSKQVIAGILVYYGNLPPFFLSVVYAANHFEERSLLWDELRQIAPIHGTAWAVLGDFNCCRFPSEKSGGNVLNTSRLAPFNSFIFDANLEDLPSSGNFYTWFNQRADNLIHIKLDRVLINETWISAYPNSYYKVCNSLVLEHTPLILKSKLDRSTSKRFMFKNFWCKIPKFWDILISIFASPSQGNPINSLYQKLNLLKKEIKSKKWASSSHLDIKCAEISAVQNQLQLQLDTNPLNFSICGLLKKINLDFAFYNSLRANWIIQRSKVKWLTNGEEDLKFLYSRIHRRNSHNLSICTLLFVIMKGLMLQTLWELLIISKSYTIPPSLFPQA
ncbi:uncharacterized protein LOC110100275 [Dendrobium catenatum]|uniref:uncharacterized protein LOC110100275 n=1 Tax=Dendrobium catenatum TaxID=906689 RepID=UPI0009F64245|nr:uncharacterized protein LOC110100275 [Dendrobium catenatum]